MILVIWFHCIVFCCVYFVLIHFVLIQMAVMLLANSLNLISTTARRSYILFYILLNVIKNPFKSFHIRTMRIHKNSHEKLTHHHHHRRHHNHHHHLSWEFEAQIMLPHYYINPKHSYYKILFVLIVLIANNWFEQEKISTKNKLKWNERIK